MWEGEESRRLQNSQKHAKCLFPLGHILLFEKKNHFPKVQPDLSSDREMKGQTFISVSQLLQENKSSLKGRGEKKEGAICVDKMKCPSRFIPTCLLHTPSLGTDSVCLPLGQIRQVLFTEMKP